MKNSILCILVCSILVASEIFAQKPTLPEMNPAFIDFISGKSKDAVQQITEDGHTLGLIPEPYIIDRSIPPVKLKKFAKLQAPSSYDLRNVGGTSYVSSVKNQGSCGSCWAFASIAALESREKMLGNGEKDFSEQNVKNCHGFYWGHCSGGNDEIAVSYFSRIAGPLSETDDPYNRLVGSCTTGYTPRSTFTHGWYLPNRNVSGYQEVLKYMIMTYGGFFTSYRHDNAYYNSTTKCYRYTGTGAGNHAVLVVGWDDNKDMSSVGATTPGAWIIKNSWGSGWGENGYFYLSYEDTKVHEAPTIWPKQIDYDNNSHLYHYDEIGAVSSTGFSSTTGYALVKYVANSNEKLHKIATWARKANTQITIEVYDDFNGNTLSNRLCTLSTQTCDYAGYYTFDLPSEVSLSQGNDFYIKVKYYTSTSNYPVPIEKQINSYCYPTIQSNVGWVSSNGTSWQAVGQGTSYPWDLCVRAYVTSSEITLSPPVLQAPSYNETNVSKTPTLNWSDISTATSYDLQCSRYSDFSNLSINQQNLTTSQYIVPQNVLSDNTLYYWRARSKNDNDVSDWASSLFTTVGLILSAPTLNTPANYATNQSVSLTLDWSDVENAESYHIMVSDNSNYSTVVIDDTVTASNFNVSSGILSFDKYYYWKVRAINGASVSSWSFVYRFKTKPLDRPTLVSPVNSALNVSLTPTASWSSVNDAESYTIELATDYSFLNIVHTKENISSNSYTIPDNVLSANTRYYWHVKAVNGTSSSPWAYYRYFTTAASYLPVLVSPYNNASDVSLTPKLDWQDYSVDYFEVQVADNSSFTSPVVNVTNLSVSEYTIPANTLSYYTMYYWRVRARIGGSYSDWSSSQFKTTQLVITAPTLVSPNDNATEVSLTPTLDWQDVSDIDSYELQISTSSSFSTTIVNVGDLTNSQFNVSSSTLAYNTDYYWRVRAKKGSNYSSYSSRKFKTLVASSSVASLLSPSNREYNVDLKPTLDWSDASGAVSYKLQISRDIYFSNLILDVSGLTNSEYVVSDGYLLDYQTTYYWRVKTVFDGSESDWTDYFRFTVTIIPRPTIISPSANARNVSLTPKLDWEDVTRAEGYSILLSKNSNFSNPIINISNLTSSEYTIPANTLNYNTIYYWKVAARYNGSEGYWTSRYKFTTLQAKLATNDFFEEPQDIGISQLLIYPNPVTDNFQLYIELMNESLLEIKLLDVLGREIINDSQSETIIYQKDFSLKNIPSGIYMLQIKSGKGKIVEKIVKQ